MRENGGRQDSALIGKFRQIISGRVVTRFLFSYHISVYIRQSCFPCVFFFTNAHTPKAVAYHQPTVKYLKC